MAEQQRIHKKSKAQKPAVQRDDKAARDSQRGAGQEILQPELLPANARRPEHADVQPLSLESLMASRGLQPKLRVTAANDRYEQEADAVASQVVDRLQAPPASTGQAQRQEEEEEPLQAKPLAATISRVQRQEQAEEEELQAQRLQRQEQPEEEELQMQRLQRQQAQPEEEELQAKQTTPIGREGGDLDAATEQDLESARGGGQPMAGNVRNPMEQAFGADFSGVRVHTGGQAHQLNRAISAKAFTTGSDIFFRQGAYEPHNRSGQELLAHELAHVVQQGNAPARRYDLQREGEDEQQQSVDGSDTATKSFQLQELSYDGLTLFLQQVLGLNDPTAVASLSVSFTFKIGVSAGIANILGASISPYITLGGTINVGDDRRLRVGASLAFGAESELNFFKFWKIYANVQANFAIAGAFEDEKHFSAFLISRISKLLKGFKRVIFGRARDRKKQLTAEEIRAIQQIGLPDGGEGYDELSQKGVSVVALKSGVGSKVGTKLGSVVDASVSADGSRTTFFKDNAEGKKVKKVGHTTTFEFSLEITLPLSIGDTKFALSTKRTIITNDANPDNDGDYLNIKFAPAVPIGAPLLEQAVQNAPTVFSGADMEDGAKRFIKAVFDPVNLLSVSGVLPTSSPALEFNMVSRSSPDDGKSFGKQLKDGDYFLQYARLTKNFSKKFEYDQEIPTGLPGLNVKLGETLALDRSVGTAEFLGTKTLTYIQTVYNGFLNRGRRGQAQWEQYLDRHTKEVYQMFIAVADPTTAASAEAKGLDTSDVSDKLDPDILNKANRFVNTCETFFSPDKMRGYDLSQEKDQHKLKSLQKHTMPSFQAYLEAAREAGKKESAGTWRLVRSGSVRARIPRAERPFQPELEMVKIDKGGGIPESGFPVNLRESYEEGFRHHVTFVGRHNSGKEISIKVDFQQPDDPGHKFVNKVYSKGLHKFSKFPMGLTILDDGFYDHAQKLERQFRTSYESRVKDGVNFQKAIKEGEKERQEQWEKELYKHLTEVMNATLDNDLKRPD